MHLIYDYMNAVEVSELAGAVGSHTIALVLIKICKLKLINE